MKFDSISENENLYCLQLNLIQLNPAIGGKGGVQPWDDFLEEMDFDDGDEISIYYRYYEKNLGYHNQEAGGLGGY